jgi:hypothetical protein
MAGIWENIGFSRWEDRVLCWPGGAHMPLDGWSLHKPVDWHTRVETNNQYVILLKVLQVNVLLLLAQHSSTVDLYLCLL